MVKKDELSSSLINKSIQTMSIDVVNPTDQTVAFNVYSVNSNGTRTMLSDYTNTKNIMLEAGKRTTIQFRLNGTSNIGFVFTERIGSSTDSVYLDNFAITYDKAATTIEQIADNNIRNINAPVEIYNLQGSHVGTFRSADTASAINLLPRGIYILRHGDDVSKILKK